MAIESGDLFVDLGASRGARAGELAELWRPLRIKHPVTGQILVDRFQIGVLRLTRVGTTLTMAEPAGGMTRAPAPGDIVILSASPVEPARTAEAALPSLTAAAPSPPLLAPPQGDAEAKELSDLFLSLRGTAPSSRIAAYDSFVQTKPKSRYAPVLREEAQSLRLLLSNAGDGHAHEPPPETTASEFDAPARASAGFPLRIAVEVLGKFKGAILHVRRPRALTYESLPMKALGQGYFAGAVPVAMVQAPSFDYFIEGVEEGGSVTTSVVGTAADPRSAIVEDPLRVKAPSRYLATAAILTDYASFNTKSNNDFVFQTEGYFGARLEDVGLRAVRSGFGVYRGRGGTLQELDVQGLSGRDVGLTYGYLEGEYAFTSLYAFVLRGIVGLRADGVSGGGQAFFRVGNDRRTNLLFGGEVLGGIGLRGITQLEWNTIRRVPIVFRTEVTNQPAGVATTPSGSVPTSIGQGEVGARAIVQVGYRLTDELTVSGRVSYQGRTINHAGPGGGAAVSYEW